MASREVVIQGPDDLLESISNLMALIENTSSETQDETLGFGEILAQLKDKAVQLKLCSGNSNFLSKHSQKTLSLQDIYAFAQRLHELCELGIKYQQDMANKNEEESLKQGELQQVLESLGGMPTTAIQIGLDGLEKINRRFGREGGDQVINELAKTIERLMQKPAKLYQEGSSLVVLGHWHSPEDATEFAAQVSNEVSKGNMGRMLKVTIGIAFEETEDVLQKMESARLLSKDGVGLFTNEMAKAVEDMNKNQALALDILEKKRFHPEYQKILQKSSSLFFKTGEKFEALWRSDELPPFNFFKEIKELNRMHEVTVSMVPMILRELKKRPDVQVSINITAEEMSEDFDGLPFSEFLLEQLEINELKPNNLIIELVEWSDYDRLGDDSLLNLKKIIKSGCLLALDDYGVRASNLVRLMQLCEHNIIPDFLKIDAALIKVYNKHLHTSKNGKCDHYSLLGIRSIVSLVKDLRATFRKDIGVVAEFVSNEKLRTALGKEGVTHFQGFYLAEPVPANKAFT